MLRALSSDSAGRWSTQSSPTPARSPAFERSRRGDLRDTVALKASTRGAAQNIIGLRHRSPPP
jgi:hypothetical protein